MNLNQALWNTIIESKSVKHHYIPVFFIKAFTDDNGRLFVYDKLHKKIISRQFSPKGIFYEDHKNSIFLNGKLVPVMETMYSIAVDSKLSDYIKGLQYFSKPEEITNEQLSHLLFFIADMTWRLPANENKLNALVDQFETIDPKRFLKYRLITETVEDYYKMARAGEVGRLFTDQVAIASNMGKVRMRMVDLNVPYFCLTDNPIIWQKFPERLSDFNLPLIFPLSKSKCFTIIDGDDYSYDGFDIQLTNQIMIHNAKRYVACHNRELLEMLVETYAVYREINDQQKIINELFDRLNKRAPSYTPSS
jgi:hypothetical protein